MPNNSAQISLDSMRIHPKLKQLLVTFIAVAVPVACLPLFIGWDMSRFLIIGLAVLFVVRALILFLARSKIGLVVLVVSSVLIIFLVGRDDPRMAGTAAAFAILATIPSIRKRSNQAMQPTAGRSDVQH